MLAVKTIVCGPLENNVYLVFDDESLEAIVIDPSIGTESVFTFIQKEKLLVKQIFITHAHADHIHGLDDVRPFTCGAPLPVWANEATAEELRVRFAYAFNPPQKGGGVPRIKLLVIPSEGVRVGRLLFQPIPVRHGILDILGFRIGSFAYLTDCSGIPSSSMPLLEGVEVLAIDGLRAMPHPTHFSIAQAAEAARALEVREAWILHLCHESFHADLEAYCARLSAPGFSVRPAWDGLELEIPG